MYTNEMESFLVISNTCGKIGAVFIAHFTNKQMIAHTNVSCLVTMNILLFRMAERKRYICSKRYCIAVLTF